MYENIINKIWANLIKDNEYSTPTGRRKFTISHIDTLIVKILTGPEQRTPVNINKEAFAVALEYLVRNNHCAANKCLIMSGNGASGPLCQATKKANNGTRCINYILPIMKANGICDINHNIPTSTWYINNYNTQ